MTDAVLSVARYIGVAMTAAGLGVAAATALLDRRRRRDQTRDALTGRFWG